MLSFVQLFKYLLTSLHNFITVLIFFLYPFLLCSCGARVQYPSINLRTASTRNLPDDLRRYKTKSVRMKSVNYSLKSEYFAKNYIMRKPITKKTNLLQFPPSIMKK